MLSVLIRGFDSLSANIKFNLQLLLGHCTENQIQPTDQKPHEATLIHLHAGTQTSYQQADYTVGKAEKMRFH